MSDIFKAESRPELLVNLMLDEIHIKPKVSKMPAEYLTEQIKTVIVNRTKADFIVFSVLSDNNVVNQKAFISLSGLPTLQPFLYNPVNNTKVYVLFYKVHVLMLKCIRNNWLNAKSVDKIYSYPGIYR